jgi:hypothetical protein
VHTVLFLKAGAWGFVASLDKGDFVAAAAGKLQYIRSMLQAETEACGAVEGAVALGLHRVVFESDSKILVKLRLIGDRCSSSGYKECWYWLL